MNLNFLKSIAVFLMGAVLVAYEENSDAANIAGASDGSKAQEQETKSISYLFVLNGGAFSFDGSTLTLENVEPELTWFTDSPAHEAGITGTHALDKLWDSEGAPFVERPPNAALIFEGGKPAIVELLKIDDQGDVISFNVKVLAGEVPASGGWCSLVIDDCCAATDTGSCDGPCGDIS